MGVPGIGRIWIACTGKGLCRISFKNNRRQFLAGLNPSVQWMEGDKQFVAVSKKLADILSGKHSSRSGLLDIRCGTPFQRKVWLQIARIPRGQTRSYAWLARAIGKPKAYRAVAKACGANPLPIVIPCHRVIASDGSIGGFSGGIETKRKLLESEGTTIRCSSPAARK